MTPDFDMNAFMSALGQTLIVALKEGQPKTSALPNQNIKPFSGSQSDNLTSFIFQITDLFDARKLPLEERLINVTSFFSENALQWYLHIRKAIQDGQRPRFTTWEAFIKCLRQAFEPPSNPMILRRQLSSLKQTSTIHDYVERFRNITAQLTDMHSTDVIHYFIEGLRDQTKHELYYRDPSSLEEAIHLACLFDTSKFIQRSVPLRARPQHALSQLPQETGHSTVAPMEIGTLSRSPKPNQSNFKKKLKCNFCHYFGHLEHECRKKATRAPNSQPASNSISANEIQEEMECLATSVSPLFIVSASLEGKPAKALIDSGATHNFVSSDLVSRDREVFKKLIRPNAVPSASMVDGSSTQSEGYLEKAQLKIDQLQCKLTAQIISIARYDLILGKPWLFQFNPFIDWRENRLEITLPKDTIVLRGIASRKESQVANGIQDTSRKVLDDSIAIFNCHISVCTGEPHSSEPRAAAVGKWQSKFPEVFEALSQLPKERKTRHNIKISDETPIALPAYRMSTLELQSLKIQLDDLLKKGFIKPSMSAWSAPALFVKKKDGTLRLCIDYRALNRVTVKHHFPIPRIDDLLDQLASARIFSKLDLASGYYQVAITPEDTEKTAFKTRYGLYEFLVMPFGLTNAPSTFQKLMNEIFSEALDSYVVVYLDDILVYSKDSNAHEKHLESVFSILSSNGLHVKETKCFFYLSRIEFLGFVVEGGQVSVDAVKVRAIENLKRPYSIRDVRAFLGMTGFYRRFIQGYASIALPLTSLLAHDSSFEWSFRHECSFQQLKKALTTAPILTLPVFTKPFTVTCDASGEAISGVLSQPTHDSASVIAYESRKLTAQEKKYAIYELELLAIVHSLKVWRCYLEGQQFVVFTDHAALKYLKTQKVVSKRVSRWLDFIASFDFSIEYKPGKANVVADALTRLESNAVQIEEEISSDWPLLLPSLNDPQKRKTLSPELIQLLEREKDNFTLEDDNIIRIIDSETSAPFIQFHQRLDHISRLHCGMGHLGIEATFNLARTRGWWPSMREDIKKWVSSCSVCAKALPSKHPSSEALHPIKPPLLPFKRWGMDFIGRLPTSKKGNRWILVAVDHFTRWPVAIATPDATTATVARFLYENILTCFGPPDEILTDRGANFLAEALREYLKLQRVKHLKTTAYHPRTNGLTERFNGTLITIMRKYANEHPDLWDLYLSQALFTCRVKAHATTGLTPFFLAYGLEPAIPGDLTNPQIALEFYDEETAENWRLQQIKKLELERMAAIERNKELQEKSKRIFDETRNTTRRYVVGELVYLKKETRGKWENYWYGPFRIETVGETGIYKLQDLDGKPKEDWVHGDRLKPVARLSGTEIHHCEVGSNPPTKEISVRECGIRV
jgi:transposase InsO family protein